MMPHRGLPHNTRLAVASEPLAQSYALRSAVCNLAHPHKGTLGEDAYLVGPKMIGVADGVGSWWEADVDPAIYARALMEASKVSCAAFRTEQREQLRGLSATPLNSRRCPSAPSAWHAARRVAIGPLPTCLRAEMQHPAPARASLASTDQPRCWPCRASDPTRVLFEAWHRLQDAQSAIVGSATACLVSLHQAKAELLCANVGDAGFIIIRPPARAVGSGGDASGSTDGLGGGGYGTLDAYAETTSKTSHHVAFRSPQQLRAFNLPFQLGRAPDTVAGEADERFETPHDAVRVRVPIRGGDVIVLATDGLFDNMPESDVLELFEKCARAPNSVRTCASFWGYVVCASACALARLVRRTLALP